MKLVMKHFLEDKMAPPPITVLLEEETGFVGSCLLEAERAG
jgi:hypothetical protein